MENVLNIKGEQKEVYLTQELDGHTFIGVDTKLLKNDLLFAIIDGDVYFYKVNKLGTDMPTKMMKYYFDIGDEAKERLISMRRQKYQEITNTGSFNVTLINGEDELIFDGKHELRLNKNQVILVENKLYQVVENTKKDKKDLTYLVEELDVKHFNVYYKLPVKEGEKLHLVNTYKEYLDNVMVIKN